MDESKFRSAIARAGFFTLKAAGEAIGLANSTFCRKVKNRNFTLAELQTMKRVFSIEDMDEIFFVEG